MELGLEAAAKSNGINYLLIHVLGISCSVHHLPVQDREILHIIKLLFRGRMSFGDLHNSFT